MGRAIPKLFARRTVPRVIPKRVCIVPESEAAGWANIGIGHMCQSNRHSHWTQHRTEEMVKARQMHWVGKHRRVATWTSHWTWAKVYLRNEASEVLCCNMQLVRGNAR